MPTTTIRIEDDLKARLAAAARAGKTPHAFILDAITETVAQAETEQAFDQRAEARWTNLLNTGKSVAWDDAKAWLATRTEPPSSRRNR